MKQFGFTYDELAVRVDVNDLTSFPDAAEFYKAIIAAAKDKGTPNADQSEVHVQKLWNLVRIEYQGEPTDMNGSCYASTLGCIKHFLVGDIGFMEAVVAIEGICEYSLLEEAAREG